jgi:hypothetical protein
LSHPNHIKHKNTEGAQNLVWHCENECKKCTLKKTRYRISIIFAINKKTMNNQVPYYIKMFLALGYIAIGIIVLTSDAGVALTGRKEYAFAFGALCIIYGIYRAYRNQKKWDETNHEKDNSIRNDYLDNMKE